MDNRKKILVTGIGGNVGQGIIRNIRKCFPEIHITGVNVSAFSAGNHLCDEFYTVPYANSNSYIQILSEICILKKINLIIPSTDFEVYFLSKNQNNFSCPIAVSDNKTAKCYLDKYLSYKHHYHNNIPFASTFLPSEYKGQFNAFIAKPRNGRGSRGLFINPKKWKKFSDEEYVIQELHYGDEITTSFYVDKKAELLGFITLQRLLDNGATSQCKVVFEYDHLILPILESIIKHSRICGSANIQSIITKEGKIYPFEVNCRISGTNSIRSNFGFEDIRYTLQEYLFNEIPSTPKVTAGVAVRIMMDVIYTDQFDYESCRDNKTPFKLF